MESLERLRGRSCWPMQHSVYVLPLLFLEQLCADGEVDLVPVFTQGDADADQAFWWKFCDGSI